jgi:hypothetical protein
LDPLIKSQLDLGSSSFRLADEVAEVEGRFELLAVAREVLAERRARRSRPEGEDSAKPNDPQSLKIEANRGIADIASQ